MLPLLQTSNGQIQAQVPEHVTTGTNVVQVRSLGMAQASDPVMVTVQRPPAAGAGSSEAQNPAPLPDSN